MPRHRHRRRPRSRRQYQRLLKSSKPTERPSVRHRPSKQAVRVSAEAVPASCCASRSAPPIPVSLTRTRTRPRSNLTAPVHLWLCACRIESIFAIIETTHRSNRATPISQMYVTRSRHRCFDHSTTNLGLGLGLVVQLMPPIAYEENPATSIGTHFVHTSTNKVRGPVNQVLVRISHTRVLPRSHLRASERTASSSSIVDA